MDIAGKEYWDKTWESSSMKDKVDIEKNYMDMRIYELINKYIRSGMHVIELGCANSKWLPFVAKKFNCSVAGVDYSEIGVKIEEERLKKEGLSGRIICCDFNNPPDELFEKFDLLMSFGVIEHFTNYDEVIKKFSFFLKKDGVIITIIPNLFSFTGGYLQKLLGKNIYNRHIRISLEQLSATHRPIFCEEYAGYFGSFSPGAINFSELNIVLEKIVSKFFYFITSAVWIILRKSGFKRECKVLSPYVLFVGKKI